MRPRVLSRHLQRLRVVLGDVSFVTGEDGFKKEFAKKR